MYWYYRILGRARFAVNSKRVEIRDLETSGQFLFSSITRARVGALVRVRVWEWESESLRARVCVSRQGNPNICLDRRHFVFWEIKAAYISRHSAH